MRTLRLISIMAAACCAVMATAETVKGELMARDEVNNTISVNVDGFVRTIAVNRSTRFSDRKGTEDPMLAHPEYLSLTGRGVEVVIEVGPGNIATSVRLQINFEVKEIGPSGVYPEGAEVEFMILPNGQRLGQDGKPIRDNLFERRFELPSPHCYPPYASPESQSWFVPVIVVDEHGVVRQVFGWHPEWVGKAIDTFIKLPPTR